MAISKYHSVQVKVLNHWLTYLKMFVLDDVYYFDVFKYDFIARKCGSQVVE